MGGGFGEGVLVTSELPVDAARMDEFLEWVHSGLEESRQAQGNLQFDIFVDPERPGRMLFVERWASRDDQSRYMTWRAEQGDLGRMREFLVGPPVVRTWDAVVRPADETAT